MAVCFKREDNSKAFTIHHHSDSLFVRLSSSVWGFHVEMKETRQSDHLVGLSTHVAGSLAFRMSPFLESADAFTSREMSSTMKPCRLAGTEHFYADDNNSKPNARTQSVTDGHSRRQYNFTPQKNSIQYQTPGDAFTKYLYIVRLKAETKLLGPNQDFRRRSLLTPTSAYSSKSPRTPR